MHGLFWTWYSPTLCPDPWAHKTKVDPSHGSIVYTVGALESRIGILVAGPEASYVQIYIYIYVYTGTCTYVYICK